jgi:hypothetical protein
MADDAKLNDPFAAIAATLRKQKNDLDDQIRISDDSSEQTNGILKKLLELRARAEKCSTGDFDGDSTSTRRS